MPKKHTGIFQDKKRKTWFISTTATVDGKKISVVKRGYLTERDAYADLERVKQDKIEKYLTDLNYQSFEEIALAYYDHYSQGVKKTTAYNVFNTFHKHIIEPFKGQSITTVLNNTTLNKFKTNISNTNVCIDTKNRVIHHMRNIVEFAYQHGYISIDEFKLANLELEPLYKGNEIVKEKQIWTQEEWQLFLDTFKDSDKYKVLFELLGHTGLRIGELRGLQVHCFNHSKNDLFICQQATSKLGGGSFAIVPPKTKSGIRHIQLSQQISDLLQDYISTLQLGQNDFIFLGKSPLGESTIRRVFNAHIEQADLIPITLHGIRHSNTTWLLSNKNLSLLQVSQISRRLGHSSKAVTLDIYMHILDNDMTSIIDNI